MMVKNVILLRVELKVGVDVYLNLEDVLSRNMVVEVQPNH